MSTTLFKKSLEKIIQPALAAHGFSRAGRLFYRRREDLLQYILFERLSQTSFNCEVCIQPLYLPTHSSLEFTFGDRLGYFFLGRDTSWVTSEEATLTEAELEKVLKPIEQYVCPWFDEITSSSQLLDWYARSWQLFTWHGYFFKKREKGVRNYRNRYDLNMKKDLGFVAARCGKTDLAIQLLNEFVYSWQKEKPDQLKDPVRNVPLLNSLKLLDALKQSPEATTQLLSEWTKQAVKKLSLSEKILL